MYNQLIFLFIVLGMLFLCNEVKAQTQCDLSGFTTYTQGGWGSPSNSTPGKIRDQNFNDVFPTGLKIGSTYTLTLTSANAVASFLPQGGTPNKFTQNYNDVTSTSAGEFAGQLVALAMNIYFDNVGKLGANPLRLKDLIIVSGPFAGLTVRELYDLANKAIGGEVTAYTYSQLSDAVAKVNENFDNGTSNKGYLTCPPTQSKASLGDFIWNDTNMNGIQDSGELGIPDVTVELYKCDGTFIKNTTTDISGYYRFNDLVPGDYYVKVIVPAGYTVSPMDASPNNGNDAIDSDIDQTTWRTTCITLKAGEYNSTVDAGLYTTPQCADLAILKTVSKTNPQCGEVFSYTIKVTNNGQANAQNITVSDLLPSPLVYVSSSSSQGTYNNAVGQWDLGNLINGASATLTINVKVDCSQAGNSTIDLGVAKGFNLFVLGNLYQPSADTEGKVAVGGDAYFSGYSIGTSLNGFSGDVLIVGHDLTYISGSVHNGNVVYGNSTNLPVNSVTIADGILRKDTPIDFAAASAYMQNLSTLLSGYTANGTTKLEWGKLEMTGSDPFLNIFTVNGSDLSNANNIVINAPSGSVVLVNINGQYASLHGGLVVNGASLGNVLYNFYQAQNLTIQGIDVRGTILAPWAALNFPAGLVTGEAIVKSMSGSGQFNNCPFAGNIPVPTTITNTASIKDGSSCDPDPNNNSSSVLINVGSTDGNGGGGDNGGGDNSGSGNWSPVSMLNNEIINAIAFDGNIMYSGTMGGHVFKSTDFGKTWTSISQGMDASFIWAIYACSGHLFAATEKGVYSYNGSSWAITGLSGKDAHDLISLNNILYAATWGSGVYRSTDYGVTWTQVNDGLGAFLVVQALTVYNGQLFAGTVGGGIYRYSAVTNNWTKTSGGYEVIWAMNATSTKIFAGSYGDGLYQSTDGMNWNKITTLSAPFIYSIEIDGTGKIYVNSWVNGVFVSSDNGNTWTALGLGGSGVTSVAVSPKSDKIFVGTKEGKLFTITNMATKVGKSDLVPTEFSLKQNYPNPFNPMTTIEFDIPVSGQYTLKIYDILGQEVATLLNSEISAGVHFISFDAGNLKSGTYIYRLSGNNVSLAKKMLLMK